MPPFPALNSVRLPNGQASAKLADTLTLCGNLLDGTGIGVQFSNPYRTAPVEIAPKRRQYVNAADRQYSESASCLAGGELHADCFCAETR